MEKSSILLDELKQYIDYWTEGKLQKDFNFATYTDEDLKEALEISITDNHRLSIEIIKLELNDRGILDLEESNKILKWQDLLNAFLKVPQKYHNLKLTYGGDDLIYLFTGFDSIGNKQDSWTVKELIGFLQSLPESELRKHIPIYDSDEVLGKLENTLNGDLFGNIYLGPLAVRWTESKGGEEGYIIEEIKDKANYKYFMMMTSDGSNNIIDFTESVALEII